MYTKSYIYCSREIRRVTRIEGGDAMSEQSMKPHWFQILLAVADGHPMRRLRVTERGREAARSSRDVLLRFFSGLGPIKVR